MVATGGACSGEGVSAAQGAGQPVPAGHAPDPPRLHCPCHQWTRKKDGKTATRILTDDQFADNSPWFDNHRGGSGASSGGPRHLCI
jgi:Family of unknown function (DUF6788)